MITLKEAQEALKARQPFNAGNLTARDNWGCYEVSSYGVVIAYYSPFVDYKIAQDAYKWSKTTSKHANIVKKAWGI